MSVVNLVYIYGWIHLLATIAKEDSVSRQSSIDLFIYGWIHLLSAIVKVSAVNLV